MARHISHILATIGQPALSRCTSWMCKFRVKIYHKIQPKTPHQLRRFPLVWCICSYLYRMVPNSSQTQRQSSHPLPHNLERSIRYSHLLSHEIYRLWLCIIVRLILTTQIQCYDMQPENTILPVI